MSAPNVVTFLGGRSHIKLGGPPESFPPTLLPAGECELRYAGHSVSRMFKRGVLTVYFVAMDHFPQTTIVLPRYYNVVVVGAGGRVSFTVLRGSDLMSEFRILFPSRYHKIRLDRFPVKWLDEGTVLGVIETVNKNYAGDDRGEAAYSKVKGIVGWVQRPAPPIPSQPSPPHLRNA